MPLLPRALNRLLEKLKFRFPLRTLKGRPAIMVSQRWKRLFKWAKWILALVGLLTSLVTFHLLLISFGIALGSFLLGLLIEKVVFRYGTLYVNPLPDFPIEESQWTGCFFGYMTLSDRSLYLPLVGWVFRDVAYAKRIHQLLLSWTLGHSQDSGKNVCQSVVADGPRYRFFCYPGPRRQPAKRFHRREEARSKRSKDTRDDVHDRLFLMLVLSKTFDLVPTSLLPTFRQKYRRGQYIFRIMSIDASGQARQVDGLTDLILLDLKIKDRKDLTRKDLEYSYLKTI